MVSTPNRNIYYLTFLVLYRIELAKGPFLFTINFSATQTTQCKGIVAVLASSPFEVRTTPGNPAGPSVNGLYDDWHNIQ